MTLAHKTSEPSNSSPEGHPLPALAVEGLRVDAPFADAIIDDISLHVDPGTILGLVGESGSGKTTTALALLGYAQGGAHITRGTVSVAGQLIDIGNENASRRLRGKLISYVPQNPGTALNPSSRIAHAVEEILHVHRRNQSKGGTAGDALERVGLPSNADFLRRFPHQLSGGQQQRVCIASSLAGGPPVVVLDEPTTGLDVVTQAQVLKELVRLAQDEQVAMVYVTHDLAVVAQIADRIAVMYGGSIVEEGPAREVLTSPGHPYTAGLIRSIPDHLRPGMLGAMPGVAVGVGNRPSGCTFAPRCSLVTEACTTARPAPVSLNKNAHTVWCIRPNDVVSAGTMEARSKERGSAASSEDVILTVQNLRTEHRGSNYTVVAAEDISFQIRRGACLALVGESGSGKTTIARTIAGLHPIAAGAVELEGKALPADARRRRREDRRRIQIVLQNPSDALNPRQTVEDAIGRPAQLLRGLNPRETKAEVSRLLDLVRLPQHAANRLPAQLSGGEKQRVGIARALAANPAVIVCDEITSALDVSVQAAVLELLVELRRDFGLGLLFITHNLGVVANIADEVLVLEKGRAAEQGPTSQILQNPQHPYTKGLLDAAPSLSRAVQLWQQWDEGL